LVGPNYARPVAAVSEAWIDANDPRVRSQTADYANWWRALNDPILDSLVQEASTQNLTLRAAGFRILEAQARRRIAAGSLFPQQQQMTFDYQRVNVSRTVANPAPNPFFEDWDTGFNLAWELDLWGRFRRAVEEQDALLDASIENYDDLLVLLQADVAQTYVQIRAFEQRIAYARQNADAQKGLYDLTVIREKAGAVSELDVRQAENIWRNTEALIPPLEAGRRQLMHALAVLIGVPPYNMDAELGRRSIPAAPTDVVVGIPADLLRRRPDVRRAEREVAAQHARIGIATSDLYPAVSILGTIGWEAASGSQLFTPDSVRGAVGPSIRWNILNYGRISNNIVAQDARTQELIARYEQAVLEANAEVEDAIAAFLQSQAQLEQVSLAEAAARRAYELAVLLYREGRVDYSRVLLASDFLTDNQDLLALTQADVAVNLIQIYKALGGGWVTRFAGPEVAQGAIGPVPAENVGAPPAGPPPMPPSPEPAQAPPPQLPPQEPLPMPGLRP
jgi:NodT family efflux transporter outer membrane factor (OMF) lipoprotein